MAGKSVFCFVIMTAFCLLSTNIYSSADVPKSVCSVSNCDTETCTANNCKQCQAGYVITQYSNSFCPKAGIPCLLCVDDYYFECPSGQCNFCTPAETCNDEAGCHTSTQIECTVCPNSYYLGQYNLCYPCGKAGCVCSPEGACIECVPGKFNTSNFCTFDCIDTCPDGTCNKDSGKCKYKDVPKSECSFPTCDPGRCIGDNCKQCNGGYIINQYANPFCPKAGTPCLLCVDDYYFECHSGDCNVCIPGTCNETHCQYSGILCHVCPNSYYLGQYNYCYPCNQSACVCASGGACVDCVPGKFNASNFCVDDCPPGCAVCTSATSCSSCATGKYGNVCESTCVDTCSDGTCDKQSGKCKHDGDDSNGGLGVCSSSFTVALMTSLGLMLSVTKN